LSVVADDPQGRSASNSDVLDIIVMTVHGANVLKWIGFDPATYSVEYFDGPPMMLPFEAQRIMRERTGQYDLYAYLEDDLIIDDPAFMAKIAWFAGEFGPRALLLPVRYEMAATGTPAKISISFRLAEEYCRPFQRPEFAQAVTARWHGSEQTFRIPNNPHAGCYVISDEQLRLWIDHPTFYDRDATWVSGLESAATYAPGKIFGLYMPAEPDPWFLQIEHFGTRYAATVAPPNCVYGDPLLLTLAEAALQSEPTSPALAALEKPGRTINALIAENDALRTELNSLKCSSTRLSKALMASLSRKIFGRNSDRGT
jgi:hypothetical protein